MMDRKNLNALSDDELKRLFLMAGDELKKRHEENLEQQKATGQLAKAGYTAATLKQLADTLFSVLKYF